MKKGVSCLLTITLIGIMGMSPALWASAAESSDYAQAQSIIQRLDHAENLQSVQISAQEVQLLLQAGGKKGKECIQKLFDSALPVPEPPENAQSTASQTENQEINRYALRHNTISDETELLDSTLMTPYYDTSTMPMNGASVPHLSSARASSWYEGSPSSFDNTRPTCKLFLYTDKGNFYGSGFLVGQSRVATAAHNIYNPAFADDKWVDSILIIPSYSTADPNGPYGYAASTSVAVSSAWMPGSTGNYMQDYGVIHINKSFTFPVFSCLIPGNSINGWWVRAQGYPGSSGNMYLVSGNIESNASTSFIMSGEQLSGSSGGPVLDARYYCIGIISRGGDGRTQAVKFTDSILNNIMSW